MKPVETHASLKVRGQRGRRAVPPVLQRVAIRGRLTGPLLDVVVEQSFVNHSRDDIEAVYTFPLPPRAVLAGLEFELRGVLYAGTVRPKRDAARDYERAITAGDTPVLVERTAAGLYTAQLGNLMAGETATIRLRYAQRVDAIGDAWRVAIPTVLAPLYGDPERDAGLAPHQVPVNSMLADYPLSFELLGCGIHDAAALRCTSHPADVVDTTDGVRLTARRGARLDRDIVVRVQHKATAVAVAARDLPEEGKDPYVALAAVRVPPLAVGASGRSPLSLRIVLDCSGSMAGGSMDWATVACQRLIGGLGAGDEFSITRFGSNHDHWQPTLVPADAASTASAIDWLYSVDADLGDTEMLAAVKAAAALPGERKHSDLLLITDGEIWAADALIRDARSAGRRVFVIGVGASPNSAFLQELADATEGRCVIVTPGEDLPDVVDPIVARLRFTTVDAIDVRWPSRPRWTMQWPSRPLPGETVFLFAGFEQRCAGRLRVAFRGPHSEGAPGTKDATVVAIEGANAVELALEGAPATDSATLGAGALRSAVAHERIRSGHFEDPARAALDYQLVSEWTSLVALARRSMDAKAGSMPRLVQIEQMIPAGWAGTGRVLASPPSARPSIPSAAAYADIGIAFSKRELSSPARFGDFRSFDPGLMGDEPAHEMQAPTAADAARAQQERRQAAIAAQRDALERCLLKLQRRRFATRIGAAGAITGIELLRWAGAPEKLVRALEAAGAAKLDTAALVDRFIAEVELLLSGETSPPRDRDPHSASAIVGEAIESFLHDWANATETQSEILRGRAREDRSRPLNLDLRRLNS